MFPNPDLNQIFRSFKPDLTLAQSGGIAALGLSVLMLPIAPLGNRYSAAGVFLFLAVTLLTRNIAIITTSVFALSLAYRFFYPGSAWHDQPWAQWYSVSSLLTGHNIFIASPLVGMSMASYLPMGDLFGGTFIALGLDEYWRVWHVVVACLLVLPVLASPSAATLMLFVATVNFFPFNDYTTAGGTLEISYALILGAVLLYRAGRITESLPLFAFAALFRQPNLMLIPFVLLALWKDRDYYRAAFFAAMLFFFGGVYILIDLKGAYLWLFKFFDLFLEGNYLEHNGLNSNYSISSLPHTFGIDDKVAWQLWPAGYLLVTLLSIGILFLLAKRLKSRENILLLGVLAPICVYIFSRGYAQYHYVAGAALPLAAFQFSLPATRPKLLRYWAPSLALFFVWAGLLPFLWFVAARADSLVWNLRHLSPVPVAHTETVTANGARTPVPNLDGEPEHHELYALGQSAEFTFAQPVRLSALRISGDTVPVQNVKGIELRWATETEMRGIIENGDIFYSLDGTNFTKLETLTNHLTYMAYPVTFSLRPTPGPVRAIRIQARKLYQEHKEWVLGKVEFFAP